MSLVKTKTEVIKNLFSLYTYLYSDVPAEVDFAKSLIAKGWVFAALKVADGFLFAPSRFVSYTGNSFEKHANDSKDGGRTNTALTKIYGDERVNKHLLQAYIKFLAQHDIQRNFETEKVIRFFYDDVNIDNGSTCYFISPTHIAGKKPFAWENFLKKEIAAIGWGHENYTDWSWQDIENDIKEHEFDNQGPALEAHGFLHGMKPGDIICAANNLHNLFGIGIIASTYRYGFKIHDCGDADSDEDWYSHYVNVAWVLTRKISPRELVKADHESLWEPYGTISRKNPVPSYISRLILQPTETYNANNISRLNWIPMALNTILYGPPGTGKTYHTINKALSIIDGPENAKLASRYEEHARFNELLDSGVVQFITFHQSISYEDFIEGIKPLYKANTMQYPVRPGIFKSICYKALKSMYHANAEKSEEIDLDILIDEFVEHLQETYKDNDYRFKTKENSELRLDKNELDNGRIVVYFRYSNASRKDSEGKTPFLIKKDKIRKMFEEKVSENEPNLKVRLQPIIPYNVSPYFAVYKSFYQYVHGRLGDQADVSLKEEQIVEDSDFERYLEQLQLLKKKGKDLKKGKPHVLIIDEINRGNISQIFGELITLIEEDKRFGREEALEVTLPYSEEQFVVPDNLYIIGTMNTADRSVEALDTALRRRFSFEEKMPELHELNENVEGVDLQQLLGKINERLEIILDRDHTIGHAWLIRCNSIPQLKEIFQNKILPLLKEFFYNDYGKIGLILGEAFFEKTGKVKEAVFAQFGRVEVDVKKELAQRAIFHLRMPDDEDLISAFQAIYLPAKPVTNA